MTNMLAAALMYARKGIPVFPCDPRNKHPYCATGFHAANTNETWIRLWWRQLPDSMIGVPCGPTSNSGRDVVTLSQQVLKKRRVPALARDRAPRTRV
jgi:Bifunctional DNA primase/polymerase, N-terminal